MLCTSKILSRVMLWCDGLWSADQDPFLSWGLHAPMHLRSPPVVVPNRNKGSLSMKGGRCPVLHQSGLTRLLNLLCGRFEL